MAKLLSIEIGNSQVRVAEMDEKKGRIYHCFQFLAPQGAVDDGFVRDTRGLGESLARELAARRIRTKRAGFVVTSGRIASREIYLPMVKKSKLQSIIEANAADYFPIDASKYMLSYNLMGADQRAAGEEKQYRLMVYASPKSISAACRETAEAAGLTLVCLDYTGNSIYAAIREALPEGTHMLMKIEEKNTLITIVRDGTLALQRNLNYGVDMAVEAVRTDPYWGVGMDFDQAEQLLCTRRCINPVLDADLPDSGTEDEESRARREVTESLRYLVGNISRIMDYYISRNQDADFSALFCCGLGAEAEGLRELLSNELAQRVDTLDSLDAVQMPKDAEGSSAYYAAVSGITKSGVNLMERAVKKKKEKKESIHGAVVVFAAGALSAGVLSAAGVAVRVQQQREQDRLNQRIEEEKSIEDIYNAYNKAKGDYANYQMMYSYTDTPNEQLVEFLEELEEKMPSNMTVDVFNSTGTQVSFTMCVTSKEEAANTLIQLRTFESLRGVTTTGIDEAEDGTVNMSVVCTYRTPATADAQGDNQ